MINSLVYQAQELLDILSSKFDEAHMEQGVARSQETMDGEVTFQIQQQAIFEITAADAEDQVIVACNLALSRFFTTLQKEFEALEYVDTRDLLASHRDRIQVTLLESLPNIEKMQMGIDYAFVIVTSYTTTCLKQHVVFLAEHVDCKLQNNVFFKTFNIF